MINSPALPPHLHVSELRSGCSDCSLVDICFPLSVTASNQLLLKRAVRQLGPYRRGEHVYRQGDPFFAIYAVRKGSLKRVVTDRGGRECVVSFLFKDDVFGLDAISTGIHVSDCVALERTLLCALPYGAVQTFAKHHPNLYAEIIRLMSSEILRLSRTTSAYGAKERTAAFLLALANRLGGKAACVNEVEVQMKRQDIAFYLAMAPETLSRILSDFETRKIIETKGKKITILNRARLESLVQSGRS